MATRARTPKEGTREPERSVAHLRATPDELKQLRARAKPFDAEAWLRDALPASPEDEEDIEEFLKLLKEMRRSGLELGEQRLARLDE
jgi:hypothetical protein